MREGVDAAVTVDLAAIEQACTERSWTCKVETVGNPTTGVVSITVAVPCYPIESHVMVLRVGSHWRISASARLSDLVDVLGVLDQHGVR